MIPILIIAFFLGAFLPGIGDIAAIALILISVAFSSLKDA